MYEAAQEIFDYLPINKSKPEADYIDHLWSAFLALDNTDNNARPFIMMPFHLLFMLALQYKGIRIAKIFPKPAELFFVGVAGRDKVQLLNPARSAFDLALIKERTLPEMFRLIELDDSAIKKFKDLIDDRNEKIAHAKGWIELSPNERIDQYLDALRDLQPFFVPHNDKIAEQWLSEITEEDDLNDYVDSCLSESQLCPADFRAGLLTVFSFDENIPPEEWPSAISRLVTSNSPSSLLWLKHLAQNHPNSEQRFNLINILEKTAPGVVG
jgi:hypothetical protein